MIVVIGPFFWRLLSPPASFADHESELDITGSVFSYESTSSLGRITCIGTIRNAGSITWEDLQIEVQYFNSAGELVDTVTDSSFDLRIRADQEITFRVFGSAARSSDQYHTHKVMIRNANEERNRL